MPCVPNYCACEIWKLSFVSLLLSLHTAYHIYSIDLLPEFKKVSLALVSLFGILRILRMVKFSVDELRRDAGKKKE